MVEDGCQRFLILMVQSSSPGLDWPRRYSGAALMAPFVNAVSLLSLEPAALLCKLEPRQVFVMDEDVCVMI